MTEPAVSLTDRDATTIDRLARIETAQWYDRRDFRQECQRLDMRLKALESRRHEPINAAGWTKLALAIALPIGVLMATGSWDHARQAATVFGAP